MAQNQITQTKLNECNTNVADVFNKYYASIARYELSNDGLDILSLHNVIHKHETHNSILLIKDHVSTSCSYSFSFNTISVDIIDKYIGNLKLNKAPGYDGLNARFVKLAGSNLNASLCSIFNQCVSNGWFPSELKMGEISPIFKKNDNLAKQNYRRAVCTKGRDLFAPVSVNRRYGEFLVHVSVTAHDPHLDSL